MKLVTICIAAFNAEKYIRTALESAISQTYENIEILICDDSSTDSTLSVIESFQNENIKLIVNETNQGYLKTFNKLLETAQGDYISFLDADDFIKPNKIELQVNYLINNPSISMVGTSIYRTDEAGRPVGEEIYPKDSSSIQTYLSDNVDACFCGSSVMIKSIVRDKIGGYRIFFNGCPAEDYDWVRRISEKFNCANLEEKLYYYRFADSSLTKKVHYTLKARYAAEISKLLSEQRIELGKDSLMDSNLMGLSNYLNDLEKLYESNPGLLYMKTSFEHSVNGNYSKAIQDLRIAIIKQPLSFSLIKSIFLVIAVIIIPQKFLLKLKNIFGVTHISKSI